MSKNTSIICPGSIIVWVLAEENLPKYISSTGKKIPPFIFSKKSISKP